MVEYDESGPDGSDVREVRREVGGGSFLSASKQISASQSS